MLKKTPIDLADTNMPNNAPAESPPDQQPQEIKQKNNAPIIITVALVAALIVGGLVYAFVFRKKSPTVTQQQTPETLTLYNWEDYTDQEVLDQFEQETGIKVELKEYGQAFEMISGVESDPADFDIIITDSPSVESLTHAKLLAKLDKSKLTNFSHIDTDLQKLYFDPTNEYSIPYLYGTTGLAINKSLVKNSITSWSAIYDTKYKGKIAILDDPRELMTAILKSLNYSINTVAQEELKQAEKQAELLKKNEVVLLDSYPALEKVVSGELAIAMAYSGDVLESQANEGSDNIEYIIPQEGSNRWVDNYVVSASSKHMEAAHQFLNFVMRPEIAAKITNSFFYASPNKDATSLINQEILANKIIYPSTESLKNLEYITSIDDSESEYNKIYNIVK